MTARIIDGKPLHRSFARASPAKSRESSAITGCCRGSPSCWSAMIPASEVYVRSKHKQTQEAGMASFEHKLPADVSQVICWR